MLGFEKRGLVPRSRYAIRGPTPMTQTAFSITHHPSFLLSKEDKTELSAKVPEARVIAEVTQQLRTAVARGEFPRRH